MTFGIPAIVVPHRRGYGGVETLTLRSEDLSRVVEPIQGRLGVGTVEALEGGLEETAVHEGV